MTTLRPLAAFALGLALATTAGGAHADLPRIAPAPPLVNTASFRLINVTRGQEVYKDGEDITFYGLRATAGKCSKLAVTIDGVTEEFADRLFPHTFVIPQNGKTYPKAPGSHTLVLEGRSPDCTGKVTTTFVTMHSPILKGQGRITALRLNNYAANNHGRLLVEGMGSCRLHILVLKGRTWAVDSANHPVVVRDIDDPVQLPHVVSQLPPLPQGDYIVSVMPLDSNDKGQPDPSVVGKHPDYKGCFGQDPQTYHRGIDVGFTSGTGTLYTSRTVLYGPPAKSVPGPGKDNTTSGGSSSGGSGGTPTPSGGGGGGGAPPTQPATGKIASMQVPGGSFAEDDPQKIQVNGTGGCGFDLAISNKTYGGSYDQTWPVLPVKLDGGATLYNGTHFGTLAEGSYHATSTGKNGCTGAAAIDFKVTPKNSTKKVLGKPTLSFDKQPVSGDTFWVSKDSNIWFKVVVPQSVKDEPYASCCDVEFDYMNPYGGWEALPNSPFNDPSYGLAVSQQAGVVNKSVSYFSQGTTWRMKVRAYKFKTEFEWSDWLPFKVDMH
jgi:hypothetical protein